MWSDLRFRVRSLFRRRAVERELDAEMLFHVQRLVDTYVSSGFDLQAARRRARREFGSFDQIREAHRDARGVRVLEELVLDSAKPYEPLASDRCLPAPPHSRSRAAFDAILVRPLAVDAPEELFVLGRVGEPRARFPLEFQHALTSSRPALTDATASFTFPVTVVRNTLGIRARAAFVSGNYFQMLGVSARRGRVFDDERDREFVVISDRFWRERFEGRSSIVGESLRIGNAPFVIAGVLRREFQGLQPDIAVDVWVPISMLSLAVPIAGLRPSVDLVGRVPAGVELSAAVSLVTAELERWTTANPARPRG